MNGAYGVVGRLLRGRAFWLVVLLAISGWGFPRVLAWAGGLDAIRVSAGPWAFLVLVPLHVFAAVSPAPGEVVAVMHGAIYGFALGTCFSWLGWLLAAITEYSIYRRLVRDAGPIENLERLPAWLRRIPFDHPAFIAGARFLPLGNQVVNTAAGLSGVPFLRFLWPTALALVPIAAGVTAVAVGLSGP